MIFCSSGWGSVRKALWSKRLWSKQSEDGAAINQDGGTSHCVPFYALKKKKSWLIGPHLKTKGKSHEFSRVAAGTWCIFSSTVGVAI